MYKFFKTLSIAFSIGTLINAWLMLNLFQDQITFLGGLLFSLNMLCNLMVLLVLFNSNTKEVKK